MNMQQKPARIDFEDRIAHIIDEDAMEGRTPGGNLDAELVIGKAQAVLDEVIVDTLSHAQRFLGNAHTEHVVLDPDVQEDMTEKMDKLKTLAEDNTDMLELIAELRDSVKDAPSMNKVLQDDEDSDPDVYVQFTDLN